MESVKVLLREKRLAFASTKATAGTRYRSQRSVKTVLGFLGLLSLLCSCTVSVLVLGS